MTNIVTLLSNTGLGLDGVYILLAIPIIAAIAVMAKQIIGLKSFNIYTTALTSIAFISTGLLYGILIAVYILLADIIAQFLIQVLNLHHNAKVAISISLVSLGTLVSIYFFTKLGLPIPQKLSIYAIVLFIIIAEILSSTKTKKGSEYGNSVYIQTILISLISYGIISIPFIKDILLSYPIISLLIIILDILMGRITTLRIIEYYRFRNIIKEKASS